MEKKTNTLAIVSLVLLIVNVLLLWVPNGLINSTYVIIAMVVIAIAQIVVSSIAKKQISKDENQKGMGMAKTCFIFGIIGVVLFSISLFGLYILDNDEMRNNYICPQATECKDNGDGTSTCMFSGEEIICNNVETEVQE